MIDRENSLESPALEVDVGPDEPTPSTSSKGPPDGDGSRGRQAP